jgi:hypothetical protein
MTVAHNPPDLQLLAPCILPDDSLFEFTTTVWLDPPTYVTNRPETTPDSNIRVMAEKEYRRTVRQLYQRLGIVFSHSVAMPLMVLLLTRLLTTLHRMR